MKPFLYKNHILILAIIVLAIGASFWGGMQYQIGRNRTATQVVGSAALQGAQSSINARQAGVQQVRFPSYSGEVVTISGSKLVLKRSDGNTSIFVLAATTRAINASNQPITLHPLSLHTQNAAQGNQPPHQSGAAFGRISSIQGSDIEVKSFEGTRHILHVTASTTVIITKVTTGTPSALKVGDTVSVFGPLLEGGAINAKSINLSPSSAAQVKPSS